MPVCGVFMLDVCVCVYVYMYDSCKLVNHACVWCVCMLDVCVCVCMCTYMILANL